MDIAKALANVDRALEPVRRIAQSPDTLHSSQMGTVAASFRHALAIVLNGDDREPVDPAAVAEPVEGSEANEALSLDDSAEANEGTASAAQNRFG